MYVCTHLLVGWVSIGVFASVLCQLQTLMFSDAPLWLWSGKNPLAVSLSDAAGRSPGYRRGETIPTKCYELM